jgi:hypothetical protein
VEDVSGGSECDLARDGGVIRGAVARITCEMRPLGGESICGGG